MSRVRMQVLAACVLSLATGPVLAAAAEEASGSLSRLEAEIRALKAENQQVKQKLARMETDRGETWLNERRAEEIKSLVREVLADADTRASLLAEGMTAGHQKGKFFLASNDGTFLMNIGGRIQVRHIYNNRDDSGADDNEAGFQIRRIKPNLSGHIGSPKFGYNITLAADRNTAAVGLEEAVISYGGLMDNLTIYAGRTKAPFMREELTSSGRQLAVERSAVNEVFTMGFTEGIGLDYKGEMFRLRAMLSDGQNQGEISGVAKDFQNDNTDFALTGRVDVKLAGDWKQIDDFAAWSGEPFGVFLGAALHYEVGETGDSQAASRRMYTGMTYLYDNFWSWTVDGSIEVSGLNIYAAGMGQHFEGTGAAMVGATTGAVDLDHYGFIIQAGYMVIPDKFEPFVRYEWIDVDDALWNDAVSIITVGFNWYINKHNTKFTFDVLYALDELNGASAPGGVSSGLGLLTDGSGEDGQIAVRSQLQLQF